MSKIKSLEDAYTYKKLNGSTKAIANNMLGILKEGNFIKPAQIEESLFTIRKNYKYTAKPEVLKALENNDIYLVFSSDKTKLPSALPFFLTEANNKIVAVVMIDTYGVQDKDTGDVRIDPKKLYVMLEGAYFARLYYTRHNSIVGSTPVIGEGSKIYSAIFTRIFNKKYALNRDKNKHSAVTYLASKFYMINMLGMSDSDTVSNYAYRNTATPNKMLIEQLDSVVRENGNVYNDISTFISFLASDESGLKLTGLTVSAFLDQYITMYYGEMLLALDYFPMFLYNVNAVTNSGYINNQYVLEDIVDNSGVKIYNAISLIK